MRGLSFILCLALFDALHSFRYMNHLERHSTENKLRKLRKNDRNWQSRRTPGSEFIERQQLDNWDFNLTAGNTTGRRFIIPLAIPLTMQNEGFVKDSRRERRTGSSETNQFILENIPDHFNFSSVGGYEDLKDEFNQVLDFIRCPHNFTQYGLRLPRGVLLEGPTGNGKSLIAKCLASEANMSFITCSGSSFIEKYSGVGPARVRELFDFAKQNQPCIIFIDEIDAIARKRSGDGDGSNGERDSTLNQLLVLMDGFHTSDERLLVVAATNRLDILDTAAIRPGRFDKIVHVPNPSANARRQIIKIHSKNKPINVSAEHLVRITNGFNGAQIENMLNEATLLALRNQSLPVTLSQIEIVREKMLIGQTNNFKRNVSDTTLRRIAIHEVGHLMMALRSSSYERPWKITIESMNPKDSFGYIIFQNDELDEGIYLREHLQDKIKVLLGGRVAEEVKYGQSVSSGALSDLMKAYEVAKSMIQNGFGRHLIYPIMSETYKKQVDDQIHQLIDKMYKESKKQIEDEMDLLDIFVEELLKRKTLMLEDIEEIHQSYIRRDVIC